MKAYLVHARTLDFQMRVDEAHRILDRCPRPAVVMSSWGKDSVALCDIAIAVWGRPTVCHLASPYKLPGWEHVEAHFAGICDLRTLEPTRTLAEYVTWCRDVGLPHERTRATHGRVVAAIKKDRGAEWATEHGFVAQVLGMRAAENKNKRGAFLRRAGDTYQARGLTVCNPLAWWSGTDVWAYILSRGLPYPRAYDCETHGQTRETIRNTGWLSTDGAHDGRISWLRRHFPDQYFQLEEDFPQVRQYL